MLSLSRHYIKFYLFLSSVNLLKAKKRPVEINESMIYNGYAVSYLKVFIYITNNTIIVITDIRENIRINVGIYLFMIHPFSHAIRSG